MANYFSQTQSGVSQSVNASAFGAGYTALSEEASRSQGGTQKQLHFLISLEFTLVAKCNARFIKKKISQLKSDIRSCRYKNIRLKQTSSGLTKVVVLFWGGGSGHTDPHPESATEGESNERFRSATNLVEKCLEA